MTIIAERRLSDSPYIEHVTRGITTMDGSSIRPAEINWHMVFMKTNGRTIPLIVGPLTTSGLASWNEGAEILWVKFKLGTFMPQLNPRRFLDLETPMPQAAGKSFWLNDSTWQFPTFENVDTFVDRLVRNDVLVRDPLVSDALQDKILTMPPRTIRHRFLRATGLTQTHIRQVERAHRAAELLRQGMSILDTVFELGYFDQPHLTRALKRFVGKTPAQIIRLNQPV